MAIVNFNHYGRAHVKPGTFVYHGCGSGELHLWRGQTVSTTRSEAHELCKQLDLTYRQADKMYWPSAECITAKAGEKIHAFCTTHYGKHRCAA